jgi:sulfate/thiosulfate transport system ATP-binding protein
MGITIQDVSKRFGSFQAVDHVSLKVEAGSLVALLGPSGSGKSTLLRLIAGLESPDSGKIFLTGEDATTRSVQERNIGFVFQHYALFKHLTVAENIGFGLKLRKEGPTTIKKRVDELLELVQLAGLAKRYPNQISGGQRQRVALARALAVKPNVLLLDEPFGALDAKVRKDLRAWLRRLHDEVHVTSVFVTHDQEEALEVADKIVVMNKGKIEQVGSAQEIYDHPKTPFVMGFIGPINVVPSDSPLVKSMKQSMSQGQDLFIRPHDIELLATPSEGASGFTIRRITHLGWEVQIELSAGYDHTITAHLNRDEFDRLNPQVGQQVFARTKDAKSFVADYSI